MNTNVASNGAGGCPRKRILLISHNSLSLHLNNGKTLAAIFDSWGCNDLAQIYFQDEIPESRKFTTFFRLRDLDIVKSLMSTLPVKCVGESVTPLVSVRQYFDHWSSPKRKLVGLVRCLGTFKLLLRDWLYAGNRWVSDGLLHWIGSFSPNSMFFVGGNSVFSFVIAQRLSYIFDVPLDIYITDDYVLNNKPDGLMGRYRHRRLLRAYREAFSVARHVFVIGDDMAAAFSKAYGREFVPVMNAVEVLPSQDNISQRQSNDEIDIVYAGSVHTGRDVSISKFGHIIQRLKNELKIDISLYVYSPHAPNHKTARLFDACGVKYAGFLNQVELKERLSAASMVLHVESFEARNISKTKLSVSTKIPEYLMSGACLVAYGPSEVASVRLIMNHGIGVVITELDNEQAGFDKLKDFVLSPEKRLEVANRGYAFAVDHFGLEVVRRKMDFYLNS